MIGLLLPLWLNLEADGEAPTHHDAPGVRLIATAADSRDIPVEVDDRNLHVATDDRTIPVTELEEVMIIKTKDSGDTLDYTRDFGGFLQSAEGIVSADWTRTPASDLTIGTGSYAKTISADGKRCTVWLSAGNTGVSYTVKVVATTNNSPARVIERSFILKVADQ